MPKPRFSLRTLLVAVTVVSAGCAIGGGLWKRSTRFQKLHDYHNAHANTFMPSQSSPGLKYLSGAPAILDLAALEKVRELKRHYEKHETWRLYHAEMAKKYRAAARKPWLTVPDNPPEPPAW